MFRAEILWLANGPNLKMDGRPVGEWVEQARYVVTTDVVPKGLIVDPASYAISVTSGVTALAACGRLDVSPVRMMPQRRHGNNERGPQLRIPMQFDAGSGRQQKEEE